MLWEPVRRGHHSDDEDDDSEYEESEETDWEIKDAYNFDGSPVEKGFEASFEEEIFTNPFDKDNPDENGEHVDGESTNIWTATISSTSS